MNNDLVEITFLCYYEQSDFEGGIQYYQRNYRESNQEIKLYILLE